MAFDKVKIETIKLKDFDGGLHYDELSEDMKDNESKDCQNVFFDHKLRTIYGGTRVNYQIGGAGSTTHINGICDFQLRDGTQKLVVATTNDILYWTGTAYASIKGALAPTDALTRFIVFNDKCIGTTGVDAPWVWTGTGNATALGGSPPRGNRIATFNGRACLGNCFTGGIQYTSRVYFSDIDDPESWDVIDNYWELETDDGQEITAMKQLGQNLIVYRNDSIGIVSGYGTGSWVVDRQFKQGVGCIAGDTLRSVNIDMGGNSIECHVFLSQFGLMGFDGTNTFLLPIPATGKLYTNFEFWDKQAKQRLPYACGGVMRKRGLYYLFHTKSGDSTNKSGAIFDYRTNSLWPTEGLHARTVAEVKHTDGQQTMYVGTDDGIIYRVDASAEGTEGTTELTTDGNMEAATTAAYTALGTATLSKTGADYLNGTKSLQIASLALLDGASQGVTTVVGKRYRMTAWVKLTAGGATTTATLQAVSSAGALLASDTAANPAAWTELTADFTATTATTAIKVITGVVANPTLLVDDLSVRDCSILSYWESKWFDFGDEQSAKIIREVVPFMESKGNYAVSFTLAYDKGYGAERNDTFSLYSTGTLWGSANWGSFNWAIDVLELIGDLSDINKDRFFSMYFKVDNSSSYRSFGLQKIHLNLMPIGSRFRP